MDVSIKDITTKKCSKCKQVKAMREFGRSRRRRDGIRSVCKCCYNKKARDLRASYVEVNSRLSLSRGGEWLLSKKLCPKCGKEKERRKFRVNFTTKDGLDSWCKECKNRSGRNWKARPSSLLGRSFSSIKNSAKSRGIAFLLTLEQYVELRNSGKCEFCGGCLPSWGGLDRKDNSMGYTVDNCVPCCFVCNVAKNDHFTYEEMITEIGPAIRRCRMAREAKSIDAAQNTDTVSVKSV